jgi:4-hydroxybenzoate polyprenyltransferase
VSAVPVTSPIAAAAGRRRALVAAAALRVRQWLKNLLLFAGLLFAARLGDGRGWLEAGAAFVVFCLAASAAYLVNDVCDADRDRLHPVKSLRPVASGALSSRRALVASLFLSALALGIAPALGLAFVIFVASFILLQVAYSLGLKHVVGLDVALIAALFVLRAAAGAAAVQVRISPWLLICTALLALFLVLAKRRAELLLVQAGRARGRPALARYSLSVTERLLTAAGAATITAYAAYTVEAQDSLVMTTTIPLVLFAVGRYLLLVRRRGVGEQPEHVLLTDRPILTAALLWVVSSAVILGLR